MKKFRNPYLSIALAFLVLFVSCSDESTQVIDEKSFDFTAFESYKNTSLKINIPNEVLNIKNERLKYEQINIILNSELNSDIVITELDELYLNDNQSKSNISEYPEVYLNDTDINLINSLESDLSSLDFNTAITNFQNNVIALNLSDVDFQKYNYFVNVLMLLENEEPGILTTSSYLSKSPCGEAIAAYSLATIGLSACWMSGPAAPFFCGAAIAAKVLAYRAMLRDCAVK